MKIPTFGGFLVDHRHKVGSTWSRMLNNGNTSRPKLRVAVPIIIGPIIQFNPTRNDRQNAKK